MTNYLIGGLALVVVGMGLYSNEQRHALNLLELQRTDAQAAATQAQELSAWQAQALAEQTAVQSMLQVIGERTAQAQVSLNTQSAQLRQGFAELKRTDEEVRNYLSGPVPAALGLRYARPATTDPIAWRAAAAAGVQPDPVPSPGAGTAKP